MNTLNKIVVVVLAGGNKRFSISEFYHQLEDLFFYREWYFRIGYKALKRIRLRGKGDDKPKPMVEYILNTLKNTECVERILVVGPEKEMREKIDPDLLADKKLELIQQRATYGRNVRAGYDQAGSRHVLFVTADSPTTGEKVVTEFVEICGKLQNDYDLIYPIVKESLLKKYSKLFPRPFFRMIADNIYPPDYINKNDMKEDGRVGFRITSMAFANLKDFPVERIDESYNVRKLFRPSARAKLKEIFGKNLISRYRQGLKMSEIEEMFFNYEGLRIKLVGLGDPDISLDIDSTRDEKTFNTLYS